MKDEHEGLMEGEIVKEEVPKSDSSLSSAPSPTDQKVKTFASLLRLLKNISQHFKKPKIISLVFLFLMAIVVYFGLSLLSTKNGEIAEDTSSKAIPKTSPQASVNPKFSDIAKKIETYKLKLDESNIDISQLEPPKVDLNITF